MFKLALNATYLFGGSPYGGYGHHSSGGAGLWQIIVGLLVGLTLTILLYVLVFPESRKASLNGFFTFLKDFFDMKYLLIEKLHIEPTGNLGSNLVATSAELSANGDNKFLLFVHKRID